MKFDEIADNVGTVKPLVRVVLSVFAPWLTGVASPLAANGLIEFNACLLRKAR